MLKVSIVRYTLGTSVFSSVFIKLIACFLCIKQQLGPKLEAISLTSHSREASDSHYTRDWTAADLFKKYLFIYLCQVLVAACGIHFLNRDQTWDPPPWEHRTLATGSPAKSQKILFKLFIMANSKGKENGVMDLHVY